MTTTCSNLPGVRSTSALYILAIIVICFIFATIWESNNLSDGRGRTVIREAYHNEIMAKSGQNYPVCMNIRSLEEQLKADLSNKRSEEDRYESLLRSGGLNCGNVREGLGLFTKRFTFLPMGTAAYIRTMIVHLSRDNTFSYSMPIF